MLLDGPIHSLLQLVFDSEPESMPEKIRRKARVAAPDACLAAGARAVDGLGVPFEKMLESEVGALLASPEFRATLACRQTTDDRIFLVISTLINRIFARYVSNLKKERGLNLVGGNQGNGRACLFKPVRFAALPGRVSATGSDCLVARDVRESFQFVAAAQTRSC